MERAGRRSVAQSRPRPDCSNRLVGRPFTCPWATGDRPYQATARSVARRISRRLAQKDAPNPRALRDLARGPGVARLRALTHQRLRHDRFTSARPPTASAPRRGWLPWRHLSRVPRSLVITNTPAHDPRCPVEARSAAQSLTATSATGPIPAEPCCACGSSGAAVCGAGAVMSWGTGRGEGARGRGGR